MYQVSVVFLMSLKEIQIYRRLETCRSHAFDVRKELMSHMTGYRLCFEAQVNKQPSQTHDSGTETSVGSTLCMKSNGWLVPPLFWRRISFNTDRSSCPQDLWVHCEHNTESNDYLINMY